MNQRAATELALLALASHPGSIDRAQMFGQASLKAANGEAWAEPDRNLPRLERETIAQLLSLWGTLEQSVLQQLGLNAASIESAGLVYQFDAVRDLAGLLMRGELFVAAAGASDGPLVQRAFAAWLRGIINARDELLAAAVDVTAATQYAYRVALQASGLQLVRNGVVRTFREAIVQRLVSGELDGLNPRTVARKLSQQFDVGNYNWERLARSEIAQAQVLGKKAEYEAAGIERVDYVTAADGLVSSICRGLAANGPYALADAPVPMRDSHPSCRCTWRPVLDD